MINYLLDLKEKAFERDVYMGVTNILLMCIGLQLFAIKCEKNVCWLWNFNCLHI